MSTRKLTIPVTTDIKINERGGCADSCQHLRGLGREYSCTLFEQPLLVDMNVTPGSPIRCWPCRLAERVTQRIYRKEKT